MTQTIKKTYLKPVINVVEMEGDKLLVDSSWEEATLNETSLEYDFTE